jgi:hypothetical protein
MTGTQLPPGGTPCFVIHRRWGCQGSSALSRPRGDLNIARCGGGTVVVLVVTTVVVVVSVVVEERV